VAAVRPYPWRALESLQRRDVVAANALSRGVAGIVDVRALVAAASELLGARLQARLRGVGSAAALAGPSVGIVVEPAGGGAAVHIEAEPGLVAAALARGLRRASPRVIDPARALTDASAGAFAAVIVAAARRAGAPLRAVAASGSSERTAALMPANCGLATFTVLVDDDAFVARLSVADSALAPARGLNLRELRSLGDVRLPLTLVAGRARSTVADVASLRVGDVWLGGCEALRLENGAWSGDVSLASSASERGLPARLLEGDRIVLREWVAELAWAPVNEDEMVDEATLLDSMADVPVVVRVEIGAAAMTAREWAQLGVGDVVGLGKRIGEPAVLRAGGVEIARGELVEIEGEVGVRIITRIGSGS